MYTAALWGSLGLIAVWIVTRAVTPALSTEPEEVSLAGVAATGLELAALVGLVVFVPPRRRARLRRVRRRVAIAWGALAGLAYAGLFALASATVVYDPGPLPGSVSVPSAAMYGGSLGFQSPWVVLVLTRHLYVSAAIWTLAFLLISATLLGLAAGLATAVADAAPACAPSRSRWLALAPSFLAVPSCCAAPLAGFLGAGAIAPLLLATPWVLAATTVFLLVQTVALTRRYRRWRRVDLASVPAKPERPRAARY